MCGITGIFAFNLVGKFNKIHVTAATMKLDKRGPDFHDIYLDEFVALGHRRLSIIDCSSGANQPMWDATGRYCIVFNGEIFNYRELRKELEAQGTTFATQSDTEVLLQLFIRHKEQALEKLNGFFAFCIFDKEAQNFFLARDRFGIKPLLYVFDEDKFIFASEMKAIIEYGIDRQIDFESLYTFLQLNYIPAPHTIFKKVKKLLPGHCMWVRRGELDVKPWYTVPYDREASEKNRLPYDEAQKTLFKLLEHSVQSRLVADVPLGSFLSGGVDSSIIAGLAKRHKPDLHTFSIGFRDEKFFDETHYANLVAKHFGTEHTVFSLTNDDLYTHVNAILDYTDEPFADSSGMNVYILSRETRKHATVALSGDGADELIAGYNKHAAFYKSLHPGLAENLGSAALPLWKILPTSRNNPLANKIRQLQKFGEGMKLTPAERYWRWAGFADEQAALNLLSTDTREALMLDIYRERKQQQISSIPADFTINDILYTDTKLVLPNDMLTKVDLMSMARGLEVRVPFLDYRVVNFLFSLPSDYKINGRTRKRILQDAFRTFLPEALYNRPKKGFEVPLLKWFRREMKSLITDDLMSEKFINDQGIFDYAEIRKLKDRLFSSSPGDVHARIWGIIVFNWWWKKYGRA